MLDTVGVDLDDMFGVRGALAVLPQELHETLLEEWTALVNASDNDVEALEGAVARATNHHIARARAYDPLVAAWRRIADSMNRYLAWRSRTRID